MQTFLVTFRFLHLLGAIVGLGGLTMAVVALPAVPVGDLREKVARLMGRWIAIALTVSVLTGLFNMSRDLPEHTSTSYAPLLMMKATLGMILFVLAMLLFHPAKAFDGLRAKRMGLLGLCIAVGVIIVALGAKLHGYYIPLDTQKGL